VGGSPANIAIAASRLGLKAVLLTAVGEELMGDFVLHTLEKEGVNASSISKKQIGQTGLAVLGIEPPDKFPLVFYRENPADIYLNIDDVARVSISSSKALLITGTALSRGSCREAALFAAEKAKAGKTTVFIDLDLRPDQWLHPRAFGLNMRTIFPLVDAIIGTEEEVFAALVDDPGHVMQGELLKDSERQWLARQIEGALAQLSGPEVLILKQGSRGVSIYIPNRDVIRAPGFAVEVLNTVGAGDAFAGGVIYGRLKWWDWYKSARMGNACGAIVVTRHGCAAAMPTEQEVLDFIHFHGGF
jgi:5-dehydro-2-deoxygluconokinase